MLAGMSLLAPRHLSHAVLCRVLLGTLLSMSHTVLAADAPTSPTTTHLVGTVLDASGKPAKGAQVGIAADQQGLLRMQDSKSWYVKVDLDGRFDLPLPTALRTVTVVARRPGSLVATSKPIALSGARREVPPLKLADGLTLTGRVIDEQRRPIVGAIVQAVIYRMPTDTIRFNREPTRSRTNRDGRFELRGLDLGAFMVSAYSSTHALANQSHEVSLAPASRQLEITLKSGVYLSGSVFDVAGQPLAGVKLANFGAMSAISASSDVRGRFRLGPFTPDQSLRIEARLTGYAPLREQVTPPRSDLVLVLDRTATLRGRVVDAATNRPVPGFQVGISSPNLKRYDEDPGVKGPRSFNTPEGRFELSNLSVGPWTITVQARGYLLWQSPDFEFRGGTAHEIAVALTKGMSLRGRVIDKMSGRALPGAEVSYTVAQGYLGSYEFDRVANPAPVISDAAGNFVLEGLPAGILTVQARPPGYQSVKQKVSVEAQGFVELAALRGAVIRGEVFAADGVTRTKAVVILKEGGSFHGYGTDDQGRFEFAREDPGRYVVEAETDSGRSEPKEVTVVEGQVLEGVTLRVMPAATVRGRLSGIPPGELLQIKSTNFMVDRFEEMYGLPNPGKDAQIDANSRYRIQGLPGGATAVGAGTQARSIVKRIEVPERGEITLDFDFDDVRVTGRVTRNGQAVPKVRVEARPLEGQSVFAFAETSPTGEYALCELAPGGYSIAAQGAKAVRVQVTAGMIQNFELAPFDLSGRAVDAQTGRGLQAVLIKLLPLSEGATNPDFPGSLDVGPSSNATGEFAIKEITAGEYQLVLYRQGFELAEQRVVVKSSITDLEIAMQPSEGVRLRVHGPGEEAVDRAYVTAQLGAAPPLQLSIALDRYGVGRLPAALAGRSLKLEGGGYEPYVVGRWNGLPLDIELRPRARR